MVWWDIEPPNHMQERKAVLEVTYNLHRNLARSLDALEGEFQPEPDSLGRLHRVDVDRGSTVEQHDVCRGDASKAFQHRVDRSRIRRWDAARLWAVVPAVHNRIDCLRLIGGSACERPA